MVEHFNLRNEYLFQRVLPKKIAEVKQQRQLENDADGKVKNPVTSANNKDSNNNSDSSSSTISDEGYLMTILDCEGISMENFSLVDIVSFILKSSYVIDNYYPGRVKRILIVNTSFTFQYAWGLASAALPAAVKAKLSFPRDLKALDEFIAPDQVSIS